MDNLFTMDELLAFNETMLGRGMPVQYDGVGYNKGDFGACSTYFYGLSNAQLADLAKRLVKYCNTQLHVDKEKMKDTAKALGEIANPSKRNNGISINITEKGTLISFRYNETFIETIKKQPKRQWDAENKNWVIPNSNVIHVLEELGKVGADVENAIAYASTHELIKKTTEKPTLTEILTKFDGDYAFLKFNYNKEIVEKIKAIEKGHRKWYPEGKFWEIYKTDFITLKENLADVAVFKVI